MADSAAAIPSTTVSIEDIRVRAQLIEVLYRRVRTTIYTNLSIGVLAVVFVFDIVPVTWLALWLGLLAALSVVRLIATHRYEKVKPDAAAAAKWGKDFTILSALSGLFWGLSALVVFGWMPMDPLLLIFAAFVLTGYVSGSVPALASYLPAWYAFVVPLIAFAIIGFMVRADQLYLALAGMSAIFLVLNFAYARNANRTLAESIALRFENVHLIEELEQKRREAEAANVAKSKFLAAASHDLRQPLHALTLFVSALDEQIRDPEIRKTVDSISTSAQALEKLFGALLDISRLDAGVIQPRMADFRLQTLFERMASECALEAQSKNLIFECVATDAVVSSDPSLLERILRNYLSNALRYTRSGTITLRCRQGGDSHRIEVSDTGRGIPLSQQQDIFREFHQLDNPERDRTKGLGLGLAIVDRLAKLLQHSIHVESQPGEGSVFGVTVPAGDPDALASQANQTAEIRIPSLSGLIVLVIDDEIGAREGMRALLGQWGCKVLLASSESEALEVLQRRGQIPDAVIADYRLRQDRTGAQAVQRIRAQCRLALPALIITGDTAPERLREVAASGLQLLHKPVAAIQLRAFLQRARKERESRLASGAEVT